MTSLSVYQNSLNTTTKERAKPAQLCILMGLYFPKKTYLSSVSTFFDQSVFIPQRKKNSIFNNSCPKTIFLLRMFVCVCVCFDIVLLDFIQNTTRKNKKKSSYLATPVCDFLFSHIPRFQSTYPDNDNVLCGCSLFVSRLMSLLCPLHFDSATPALSLRERNKIKKNKKKIMSLTRILKNKIKKENTMPVFMVNFEFEDVIIKLANQAIWNWVKGIPFCGHLKCPFLNNRVGTNE